MNWTFQFQNKIKTSLLFLVVVVAILGCNFLEERYMNKMNDSVSSIYNDRLMPEAYLLHINNHMFNRRLLHESYLQQPHTHTLGEVKSQLVHHQQKIDSLIAQLEITYLVPEEKLLLTSIKSRIGKYNQLENQQLALHTRAPYSEQLLLVFNECNTELLALSNIQTSVGESLYRGTKVIQGSAWTISHLQIAIVILIMLAVQALLFSSRSAVPKKFQKFNWN